MKTSALTLMLAALFTFVDSVPAAVTSESFVSAPDSFTYTAQGNQGLEGDFGFGSFAGDGWAITNTGFDALFQYAAAFNDNRQFVFQHSGTFLDHEGNFLDDNSLGLFGFGLPASLTGTILTESKTIAHGSGFDKYTSKLEILSASASDISWELTLTGRHIPEPATFYLSGLGLLVMCSRWRKQGKTSPGD